MQRPKTDKKVLLLILLRKRIGPEKVVLMKKMRCLIIGLNMLVCGSGAVPGQSGLDFEVTADFFSKYLWRGQNLNDYPVFQTGINLSYRKLTATIWGNMDLTNINGNGGDFSELDYCLNYSSKVPGIKGVGYTYGTDSDLFFAGVSLSKSF